MSRKALVVLLITLCCVPGRISAATPQAVKTAQEQVLELAPGTLVQVKLKNKQTLRGRLGEAGNDGFNLQYAEGNRVETKMVSYAEVKSVKTLQGDGKGTRFLAAFGAVFLVLIVVSLIATGGRA